VSLEYDLVCMCRGDNLRDVVVDDLQDALVAGIREQIEGLGLDICVVKRHPLEVLLGQLGVGRLVALLSNRLNGLRAVFGLLGAGNRG